MRNALHAALLGAAFVALAPLANAAVAVPDLEDIDGMVTTFGNDTPPTDHHHHRNHHHDMQGD